MDLTIIILNYKNQGLVKQSLRNLLPNKIARPHEIIVVDNHSQDGCIEMVKTNFPEVKTIALEKNLGYAAGNNQALRRAKGEFILILNPDVAVMPDTIEKLYNFMCSHPRIGICGPRLINPDGSIQFSCYRWPKFMTPFYRRTFLGKLPWAKKELARYLMKDFNHNTSEPVAWLLGACLMVRKECLKTVGLFDERFFLYIEDIDLCRRFWQKGFSVYYYPETEMVHYHQRLSAEYTGLKNFSNKTAYYHIASWLKYQLKYLGKKPPKVQS